MRVYTSFHFVTRHSESKIRTNKAIFTHRLRASIARFTFCWWRRNWLIAQCIMESSNCYAGAWKVIWNIRLVLSWWYSRTNFISSTITSTSSLYGIWDPSPNIDDTVPRCPLYLHTHWICLMMSWTSSTLFRWSYGPEIKKLFGSTVTEGACKISERSDNFKAISRGFEFSRHFGGKTSYTLMNKGPGWPSWPEEV